MVILWCKWLTKVCVHWQIFWTIFQGISLLNRICSSHFFIRTLISCMFWYLLSNCSASLNLQNRYMLIRLFNTESPISVLFKVCQTSPESLYINIYSYHYILICVCRKCPGSVSASSWVGPSCCSTVAWPYIWFIKCQQSCSCSSIQTSQCFQKWMWLLLPWA